MAPHPHGHCLPWLDGRRSSHVHLISHPGICPFLHLLQTAHDKHLQIAVTMVLDRLVTMIATMPEKCTVDGRDHVVLHHYFTGFVWLATLRLCSSGWTGEGEGHTAASVLAACGFCVSPGRLLCNLSQQGVTLLSNTFLLLLEYHF